MREMKKEKKGQRLGGSIGDMSGDMRRAHVPCDPLELQSAFTTLVLDKRPMRIDIFRRILYQNSFAGGPEEASFTHFDTKSIRNLIDFHRAVIQN